MKKGQSGDDRTSWFRAHSTEDVVSLQSEMYLDEDDFASQPIKESLMFISNPWFPAHDG